MNPWRTEPNLKDVLSDPIVLLVMYRDGVEPRELRELAARVTSRSDKAASFQPCFEH